MPLSRQEAEALARLASRKEGATARCEPGGEDAWVVIVTDEAGEHRLTSGPDFNLWDHGAPTATEPEPLESKRHWLLRLLSAMVSAFFGLVREMGRAMHPGRGGPRRF